MKSVAFLSRGCNLYGYFMAGVVFLCGHAASAAPLVFHTPYYSIELAPDARGVIALAVDALGQGAFRPNALLPVASAISHQGTKAIRTGQIVRYQGGPMGGWSFHFHDDTIEIESRYQRHANSAAVVLRFDPEVTHATLLGQDAGGRVRLPALLHLPGEGSIEISARAKGSPSLRYDARRRGRGYIEVAFPPATGSNPIIFYSLRVKAIYPRVPGIENDPRFDGFRRDYINALQLHAQYGVLANHSASDPCAFVLFMSSEVAKFAPPLAPNLTAMDLVRASLDRYLGGFIGYGLPGFRMFDADSEDENDSRVTFLDTYPSLLIAAGDYVTATQDAAWLKKNYPGLRKWTEKMLATDTNGDGLVKYGASGNAGSWKTRANGNPDLRPANWWDTIGFGYEDAYSNALAYHALQLMSELAHRNGETEDAKRYMQRAQKLHDAYAGTFLNPRTGVIAGWRSQDGALHDYYFLWVNGAAVLYGLVSDEQGNAIYDRLLAKMQEVGFTHFEFGLPGNLLPIRKEDYVVGEHRWGGSQREDGSDGFQIYENGGATASFVYFTIASLYKLGRIEDGDRVLRPMLQSFKAGSFAGRGANGFTNDWKSWQGTPNGYEGFLADNYMAMAAVMRRPAGAPPL